MNDFAARLDRARQAVGDAEITEVDDNSPLADQVRAGERESLREAFGLVATGVIRIESLTAVDGLSSETVARGLAAILRCVPCDHPGASPRTAALPIGILACQPCLNAVVKAKPQLPPGTERRCDWCDDDGHDVFAPVILQFGDVVITGEACMACKEILNRA